MHAFRGCAQRREDGLSVAAQSVNGVEKAVVSSDHLAPRSERPARVAVEREQLVRREWLKAEQPRQAKWGATCRGTTYRRFWPNLARRQWAPVRVEKRAELQR